MPCKDKERRREQSREGVSRYAKRHKENRLCVRCSKPAAEYSLLCLDHLSREHQRMRMYRLIPAFRERNQTYSKARYYKFKVDNKCTQCGMPLDDESRCGARCLNCGIKGNSHR